MAFRMNQNSLFAILLRSPWWYAVLIGIFVIAVSLAIAGGKFLLLGIFGAIPFLGIGAYAGHKQAQLPSQKRVLEVTSEARKMPAKQIAEKVADSYIQERYDSEVFNGGAAELVLTRGQHKLLLASKRFKAGNTGIAPLKELVAAGESAEATGYLYVALGDISDAAWDYAKQNNIEVIQASRLTAFFDGKAQLS